MKFDPKKPKLVVYQSSSTGNENGDITYFSKLIDTYNKYGINVINLSFIFAKEKTADDICLKTNNNYCLVPDWGVCGSAILEWIAFSTSDRAKLKARFNGIIMVSFGGAGGSLQIDSLTGYNIPKLAQDCLDFVIEKNLDGIDIDIEGNYNNPIYSNFCTQIADTFKNNKQLSLYVSTAPEADNTSFKNFYTNVYEPNSQNIDWLNIQVYNQTSMFTNYDYTMINSYNSDTPLSVVSLITGKYNFDYTPTIASNCTRVLQPTITIPNYKIVIGSCIKGALNLDCPPYNSHPTVTGGTNGGCSVYPVYTECNESFGGYVDPLLIASFIEKASQSNIQELKEWLKCGGMMVWQYISSHPEDQEDNSNILKAFKIVSTYMQPGTGPSDPCQGIICNDPYGECVNGNCTCYYGYSGTDCKILPNCKLSSNYKLITDQYTHSKNIIYLIFGLILLFSGFIGILITNRNKTPLTIQIYKKYINIASIVSITIGIVLIILYTQIVSRPTPTTLVGFKCVNGVCTYTNSGSDTLETCINTGCATPTPTPTTLVGFKCVNGVCTYTNSGNDTYDTCMKTCTAPTTGCGPKNKVCNANEVCMQKNGKRGNDPNGICVTCSSNTCNPTCVNGTCVNSMCKCNTGWSGPTCEIPTTPDSNSLRMVTYIEGWDNPSDVKLGTPENYTHVCLAFGVPYHFYGGYCSGNCSLWLSWYFGSDPSGKGITDVKNVIKTLRDKNPNIKILFSFGGWALLHMNWSKDGSSGTSCNKVCNPSNEDMDNPACYGPGGSLSGTYPECPDGTPDQVYNCTSVSDTIQPSEYCYGPNAKAGRAEYVGDQVIKIVNNLGLDGFDFDLEDTCDFFKSDSPGLQFMVDLIKYLRSKSSMILSMAPMNAYVITDPTINTESGGSGCDPQPFTVCATNYTNKMKEIVDDLDFISVQFYNGAPYASTQPDIVIKAYKQIVDLMGSANKVVVGMCSFAESGTCQAPNDCGSDCPFGQSRADNIVKKLMNTYGKNFGGVMQWASNGDFNGSFSKPMLTAMGK